MVFGKGLDPIPQTLVQRQQAEILARENEKTREARREETYDTMLQNIATQGMGDLLARQKEDRAWERKQSEYEIQEEITVRGEERAQERGLENAERARMVQIEEEMVKLSAMSDEAEEAKMAMEIVSGIRSQSAWASQPIASGGGNIQDEIDNLTKQIDRLDNTATNMSIKQGFQNDIIALKSQQAQMSSLVRSGNEAFNTALARSTNGSVSGMRREDRQNLFGSNGWVPRLAKANGVLRNNLMKLRQAQYNNLRTRRGGPELPEMLRRHAALQTESTGTEAENKVRNKNNERYRRPSRGNRPGNRRPTTPTRILPETSDTNLTEQKDARFDAINLSNLANETGNSAYVAEQHIPLSDIGLGQTGAEEEVSRSPRERTRREIIIAYASDLKNNTGVRAASGYGAAPKASRGLAAVIQGERQDRQAVVKDQLAAKLQLHKLKGQVVKTVTDSARHNALDQTVRYLMQDPVVKAAQDHNNGLDIPQDILGSVGKHAVAVAQMYGVNGTSLAEDSGFIESNPQFKQAYNDLKEQEFWGGGRITIKDVMAYSHILQLADYLDTSGIESLANKRVLPVAGIEATNDARAPHRDAGKVTRIPGMNPHTGKGASKILEQIAIDSVVAHRNGPAALYAVAAGRVNFGSPLGARDQDWGAGGNGAQLNRVVGDIMSDPDVSDAYKGMLSRARKDNKRMQDPDNPHQEIIYITKANYNAFYREVQPIMTNLLNDHGIFKMLVNLGRR